MDRPPEVSGGLGSRPSGTGRRQRRNASTLNLREAARSVISPDSHADDTRLQSAFKLLRAQAPVLWVDTPGVRPFWLLSRHADITAVERKGAPFAADRRACPRHDLSSVIANARVNGEPVPDYERFSYYTMIATGGHDTIAFCLGGGMHALVEHPGQLARLRADPSPIDIAIEEMLHWTTPGRHIMRTATDDAELGGQTIRAGEAVALFFNSANRDEAVFANADQFRIDRRPNPHLAFGLGQHHCIGAHLARREMRALLKALLPRLESVELAAPPSRTCSTMVTGIASLPIRCVWRPSDP